MSGQPGRESAGVTHEAGRVTHEDDDVYRAADDGPYPDADDGANDGGDDGGDEGGDEGGDGGVGEAIAGELALMDPAVRASRALFERLLDPEFVEVGSSGRRYTYEEMLAWLPEHPGSSRSGPRHRPSAIEGVLLAPGLIHLTYETDFDGRMGPAQLSVAQARRGDGLADVLPPGDPGPARGRTASARLALAGFLGHGDGGPHQRRSGL